MDEMKKEFLVPEAEVVVFVDSDIITVSAGLDGWVNDDNTEVWG